MGTRRTRRTAHRSVRGAAMITALVAPGFCGGWQLSGVPPSAPETPAADGELRPADEPSEPPTLRPPLVIPPVEDADRPVAPPPTAGPATEEVLDLIRQQGSILEGSVLDEIAGPEAGAAPEEQREREIRTAELLLRAARRLRQIDPEDTQRAELARQMRVEALRVLRAALAPPGP